MINRKKYILKRKYISPMLVIEETEPWDMIAGSPGDFEESGMPGGGNDDPLQHLQTSKSNSFFEQYTNDFEETTEE